MVKHLKKTEIIQKGCFYTPINLVNIVYNLIQKHNVTFDFICDTSAGYGDFIRQENKNKFIYVDIDKQALKICQEKHSTLFKYLHLNSLSGLNREKLGIKNSKLLIIGNPPYNNTTSFFQNGKKGKMPINDEIKSNDLGISFLRSYDLLKANYVCVLHPLSYLIKKSNFASLKNFKDNYSLIDGYVVSSKEFDLTSYKTPFPILIALYKRQSQGMTFEWIKSFTFKIYKSQYKFNINQFMYIDDLHTKYKNKVVVGDYSHFYTLRDMNWLSINKTWLDQETGNSIRVNADYKKLFFYVDQLKKWFLKHKNIYWFLGNLSPIIIPDWSKKEQITEKEFNAFFENQLTVNNAILQHCGNDLMWKFTKISANGKYRFKNRENSLSHGQVLASATNEVSNKSFLEVQIAYDKNKKDFYSKPSLAKATFYNNKNEKKFIFELSDIVYWGIDKKWESKQYLKKILLTIKGKNFKLVEEQFSIKRDKTQKTSFFCNLDFHSLPIIKPSFISKQIENNLIEIKVDYKQKAVGTQAMLFLNINAQNLTKNNKTIIGQLINTKDQVEYKINKKTFNAIFLKLMLIFAQLSKNHRKDILAITEQIIDKLEEQKNLCKIQILNNH